jgi:hypothetical protein
MYTLRLLSIGETKALAETTIEINQLLHLADSYYLTVTCMVLKG